MFVLRKLKFEMDRGIQLKNCAFDFRIEDFRPHKITYIAYIKDLGEFFLTLTEK